MSSQIADTCAPGAEEVGVLFPNEPGRIRLGGLWPEDLARMRDQDDGYEFVDYGLEDDGYHYWAEFTRRC